MNLIDFYKSALISSGTTVDSNGVVFDEKGNPIKVSVPVGETKKEKILILPTKEVLKDPNWDDYVAFHPACESRLLGSSPILNTLSKLINLRLYHAYVNLIGFTCSLALDKANHQGLTLAQSEFLSGLESISKANVDYITKCISNLDKWNLIRIKISRNEKIGDTTYFSVARVTYHLANAETEKDSHKSIVMFNKIMDKLLPSELLFTSTSDIAPKLITLLSAYSKVVEKINSVTNILGRFATFNSNVYKYPIDLDWSSSVKDIPNMFKQDLNLVLNYNDGIASKDNPSHNSNQPSHNLPPINKGNINPNNQSNPYVSPPSSRPQWNKQPENKPNAGISDSLRVLLGGVNNPVSQPGYPSVISSPFDNPIPSPYSQQPMYPPPQSPYQQQPPYNAYSNQPQPNMNGYNQTIWEQNNSGMNNNPGNFYSTNPTFRNC